MTYFLINQKYITLILFILCILIAHTNLHGQSFFTLLYPQNENHYESNDYTHGYLRYNYTHYNVFTVKSSTNENQHFHLHSQSIDALIKYPVSPGQLLQFEASYIKPEHELYTDNLYDKDDYLKITRDKNQYQSRITYMYKNYFISGGFGYTHGYSYEFSIGMVIWRGILAFRYSQDIYHYDFMYSVQDESGIIQLDFSSDTYSAYYKNKFFDINGYYKKIYPIKHKDRIHSVIDGESIGLKSIFSYNQFKFACEYDEGIVNTELYDDKSPFALMDNFSFKHYVFSGQYTLKYITVKSGVTGFKAEIGDKSYIEIWPFTFWDIFLASKTRLEKMEIEIMMPFGQTEFHYSVKTKKIYVHTGLTMSYYHLYFNNSTIISEKKWDVYPLVSHYESREIEFDPQIDGLSQIKGHITFKYLHIELSCFASQIIPIDFSTIQKKVNSLGKKSDENKSVSSMASHSGEERSKKEITGGTFFRVYVTAYY